MVPEMKREVMLHLQRKHSYIGKAWYRKTIDIPRNAAGKKAELTLERVLWKSTVYVDGKKVGSENSLSVPHRYDLSPFLSPGRRQLLICIDNSKQFELNPNDMAHAYTDETQIMWNGILGDFGIRFSEAGSARVRIFAGADGRTVRAVIDGENIEHDRVRLTVRSGQQRVLLAEAEFEREAALFARQPGMRHFPAYGSPSGSHRRMAEHFQNGPFVRAESSSFSFLVSATCSI